MEISRMSAELDGLLQVEHYFCDGLYAKRMRIKAGYTVGKHVHDFTHMSALKSGRVIVTVDGAPAEYAAPAWVEIQAGREHTIHALEDAVWFCTHLTDETDPEHIDEELIA
jgi:quercetin dioxygenase-like cupin family protein